MMNSKLVNKKCVIKNYIPHKTILKNNYKEWYNEYSYHLYNIFMIIQEILDYKYPKKYSLNFNNFCILAYKSSSKYILK